MTMFLESYREQRPLRGDILIVEPVGKPVFVHVGPPEWSKDYNPRQGFYVYPESRVVLDKKNLILNDASLLMSQRMQPGTTAVTAGINALAVGTGLGTGTTQNPQAPDPTLHALRQEIYRKLIDSWTFLDANGNPTGAATGVMQLTTNLAGSAVVPSGQTSSALSEMMLLGGDTASATNNTHPYNMVTFPVWNLQNTGTLAVVWTLTF